LSFFSFAMTDEADSASISEKRTPYVGAFSEYADQIVSPTTATKAMVSVVSCRAERAPAEALRRERSASRFTAGSQRGRFRQTCA
jgi:uncharacterized DUF497 family protein